MNKNSVHLQILISGQVLIMLVMPLILFATPAIARSERASSASGTVGDSCAEMVSGGNGDPGDGFIGDPGDGDDKGTNFLVLPFPKKEKGGGWEPFDCNGMDSRPILFMCKLLLINKINF